VSIHYLTITKSWWDTVDTLVSDCSGSYFKMFSEFIRSITGRWNTSENMCLQRSSLLFQKSYKKYTDNTLLSSYISHPASPKKCFIQKAIGWVLSEYARTNLEWVRCLPGQHHLAPLTREK
jgi:3-methyladenine DNA glycosylase AlkD